MIFSFTFTLLSSLYLFLIYFFINLYAISGESIHNISALWSPVEWFDQIFSSIALKPSNISAIKSLDGKPCIMNLPAKNMGNKYMGNHLDKCLDMIDDALNSEPDCRFKSVVVTLRGVG